MLPGAIVGPRSVGAVTVEWAPRDDRTNSVVFRRAVEADLSDVIGLLNDDQFGQARNPLFSEAPSDYQSAFAYLVDNRDNGEIVAVRDHRIIGCYQLTFIRGLSHSGAERAQIESVRIAGDLRGGGLGTLLMEDAIERARLRGCFLVQLTTDLRREHTRRFYERLGFVASHHGMKQTLM